MTLSIQTSIDKHFKNKNFKQYTEIQEQAIPKILEGKDLFWIAKTWSGKTLAFWIPVLEKIFNKKLTTVQCLILVPTRELVNQIAVEISPLCRDLKIRTLSITWWVNQIKQEKEIYKNPNIIIATPWRLIDLINQDVVNLKNLETLVLDEADKMLDMWFITDIKTVLSIIPKQSQKLLFSATQSEEIKELSDTLLDSPEKLEVHKKNTIVEEINEFSILLKEEEKEQALQFLLTKNKYKSCIIFVKTKDNTELVLGYLQALWLKVSHIHRNRSQNARHKALNQLKTWEINYLVGTDILSRWIDVIDLDCVINFDIPKENEVYIHRVWRTWRAGKAGDAITFYTQEQEHKIKIIQELTWKIIQPMNIDGFKDFEVKINIPKKTNLSERNTQQNKKKRYYWKRR